MTSICKFCQNVHQVKSTLEYQEKIENKLENIPKSYEEHQTCDVCQGVSSFLFTFLSTVCLYNFVYFFCSRFNKKIMKRYFVTSATFVFTKHVMALLVSHPNLGKKICYLRKIVKLVIHISILLHFFLGFVIHVP